MKKDFENSRMKVPFFSITIHNVNRKKYYGFDKLTSNMPIGLVAHNAILKDPEFDSSPGPENLRYATISIERVL